MAAYGGWVRDHTGLSNTLAGEDEASKRAAQKAALDADRALMDEVRKISSNLETSLILTD